MIKAIEKKKKKKSMIQDPSAKAQPKANQIPGRIKKFNFICLTGHE